MKATRSRLLLLAFALALVLAVPAKASAYGDYLKALDDTFGARGKVVVGGGRPGTPTQIETLPDGKVLLVGHWDNGAEYPSDFSWFVARLNDDGVIDTSFGRAGYANFGAQSIVDVATTSDGSVFVATPGDIWALRSDGSRDKAFSGNGVMALSELPERMKIAAIAANPSGGVVLAGTPPSDNDTVGTLVERLKRDGRMDGSFGSGGVVAVPGKTRIAWASEARDVGVTEDESIVLLSHTVCDAARLHCGQILRFGARGTRDMSFGDGGAVAVIPANFNSARRYFTSIAVRPSGEFAAATETIDPGSRGQVGYYYDSYHYNRLGVRTAGNSFSYSGRRIRVFPGGGYAAADREGQFGAWIVALSRVPVGSVPSDYYVSYWFGFGQNGKAIDVAPATGNELLAAGRTCLDVCRIGLAKMDLSGDKRGALAGWIRTPENGVFSGEKNAPFFAGDAFPASRVARVDVALLKDDPELLKKGRCRWVRRDFAHYSIRRASLGACVTPHWWKARGTADWTVAERSHSLAPGLYTVRIRVVGRDGSSTSYSDDAGMTERFRIYKHDHEFW